MVKVVKSTSDLIQERAQETKTIGFVPTMGNLHAGHISLLERALDENEVVYFSIFVNPKQFGPNEDFNKYPRTLEQDIKQIEEIARKYPQKSVMIYAPTDTSEVFPPGYNQTISTTGLSTVLEGAIRPGHFDGVATVVFRLFELVKPQNAYFGLKDYQQYMVICQMVQDLILPIKIVGMPIIRETSGLALSSRNQYLSAEQKEEALILSKTMKKIGALINGKKANLNFAQAEIKNALTDSRWNYLELRDSQTLSMNLGQSSKVTLLGVIQLGSTRLLDNLQMEIQ
jgi:pantoate--beta-alanine ligase